MMQHFNTDPALDLNNIAYDTNQCRVMANVFLIVGSTRNSQAATHLYPALTVKVLLSLDFIYLVFLDRISGGYQKDILEQFEKSKMAATKCYRRNPYLMLFFKF